MNRVILISVFILAYLQGFLETYLQLTPSVTRALIDFGILILLFRSVAFRKSRIKYEGAFYLLLFLIVIMVSALYNNVSLIMDIVFFRKYYIYIFFFYAVRNLPFLKEDFRVVWRIILLLIILQIPVSVIKYFTIGVAEHPMIGSIANLGGAISTVLPLLATTIFITYFLLTRKLYYLFLILGMFLFGIVGAKRAVGFYLPLIIFLAFFSFQILVNKRRILSIFKLRVVVNLAIVFFVTLYFFIRVTPSLNPEKSHWGTFSPSFAYEYFQQYEHREGEISGEYIEGSGRGDAYSVALSYLQGKDLMSVMFGFGPGTIELTSLVEGNSERLTKMNLGYALSMIGATRTVIQVGIIGLLLWSCFHLRIFVLLLRRIRSFRLNKKYPFLFIALCAFYVYFIDFYFYSPTIFLEPALALTFYFCAGIGLSFGDDIKKVDQT